MRLRVHTPGVGHVQPKIDAAFLRQCAVIEVVAGVLKTRVLFRFKNKKCTQRLGVSDFLHTVRVLQRTEVHANMLPGSVLLSSCFSEQIAKVMAALTVAFGVIP